MDVSSLDVRKLACDRLTWEHIAFAFALSGPFGATRTKPSDSLKPQTVLTVLRSLILCRVILHAPDQSSVFHSSIERCSQTLLEELTNDAASKISWKELGTQKSISSLVKASATSRTATNLFFGLGDTLAALLGSNSMLSLSSLAYDQYSIPAKAASEKLLSGHPQQSNFQRWLARSEDATRIVSDHTPSTKFDLLGFLGATPKWSFWFEWYRNLLDGKPLDWEIQRRVALIHDEIWEQGPEAVAAAIDEIRAEMLAEKLPQADKVSFDPDKAVFETKPVPLNAQSLVDTTLKQVAFAQKIAAQSNCGFNSNSVAWQYIDYTLEDCREDANAIEQNLEIARTDIVEGLNNGTYFEDTRLSALEQVLDRAVTDLRANHPDVAAAWEVRIKHNLRVAKADQKQIIVEKATALIEVTHEKMGSELALDAKTIATTDGEVQGHAIRRFFGRIAQMRILLRSSEVVRTIDENTAFKATAILLNLQSLINIATGLM